jgi:hypothetical protein
MPGTAVDLQVAARLGVRALARRLRGRRSPPPDHAAFRAAFERAFAALPEGLVAERRWVALPASEPPWHDTGVALQPGDEVSTFACGRAVVSAALDIWVGASTQIWARIGERGPIRSATRESNTLRAESAGRLYLGNYFPNDWRDRTGARVLDDSVHRSVGGRFDVLVVRWARGANEGLAALVAAGDPLGLASSEQARIARGDPAPEGWHYLWHLGDAEIFERRFGPEGEDCLHCDVHGDVGILQREARFPLLPGTRVGWRWRVEALPGVLREDSVPSHDYLSLAVEFENGLDLTYYWSRELPVGTAFWCPLPNWKDREFHVVIRSGEAGLGAWHDEDRDLHADAIRHLGSHPGDVVRVWLIAVSVFEREPGRCDFAAIRLTAGDRSLTVL